MDRQAQLEAMMRQYMASQQNMGGPTDADMAIQQNQQFNQDAQQQQADMFYQNQMQQYGAERPMPPQQNMGQMSDADMAIMQNQQFNQNAQQYQADQFRGSQQISPEQYMGLLQMLGGGR
jgi:hypothetical protein